MSHEDIQKLRASIDAIDDRIIDLLNERSGYVKQVGMTKKKRAADGKAFIRSGREAELVRRIYRKLESGVFPPQAAAQIWRLIICASLSLESQLTITAYAPESHSEIYALAQDYFGSFTSVAKQPTAKRVLGDVIDGKAEVGVLPLPDDTPEGSWWPRMPEGLRVFACLPFVLAKGAEIKALAVAKVDPEPTGDDISYVSLETDMDVSQSRLKAAFDKQKLEVHWRAVESFASGHRAHLVEIKGFISPQDSTMRALTKEIGASLLAINPIGAYATPLIYAKK